MIPVKQQQIRRHTGWRGLGLADHGLLARKQRGDRLSLSESPCVLTMQNILGLAKLDFVVVDVEVASRRRGSICQAGLACVKGGVLSSSRSWLLRPSGSSSDSRMTRLHGIASEALREAPVWLDVYPELRRELQGRVIVSHSFFDRKQIFAACCRSGTVMFSYRCWFDSCALARQAWPGLPTYALSSLAARVGFRYTPHNAEEDARAAAAVCLAALRTLRGES